MISGQQRSTTLLRSLVLAHIDEAPYIAGDRDLIKGSLGSYLPVSVDIEVVDDVKLRTAAGTVWIVATPGHTPGHISIYVPNQEVLLAADAITAEGEFDGPNEGATVDMVEATDSISRSRKCLREGEVNASVSPVYGTNESVA